MHRKTHTKYAHNKRKKKCMSSSFNAFSLLYISFLQLYPTERVTQMNRRGEKEICEEKIKKEKERKKRKKEEMQYRSRSNTFIMAIDRVSVECEGEKYFYFHMLSFSTLLPLDICIIFIFDVIQVNLYEYVKIFLFKKRYVV